MVEHILFEVVQPKRIIIITVDPLLKSDNNYDLNFKHMNITTIPGGIRPFAFRQFSLT